LRTGDLDRRIVIYTATTARDSMGQSVETPAILATVWAKITPVGGGEDTEGDKVTASNRVMFTIRFRTDVTEAMQILFDTEYYDIVTIEKPDRKRRLEITAEKKY